MLIFSLDTSSRTSVASSLGTVAERSRMARICSSRCVRILPSMDFSRTWQVSTTHLLFAFALTSLFLLSKFMLKSRRSPKCHGPGGVCLSQQRMMAHPRLFAAIRPSTYPVLVCHPSPSTMRPLRLHNHLDPRHGLSKCYITKFHRISSMEAILDTAKWIPSRAQIQNSRSLAKVTGLPYRPLLVYVLFFSTFFLSPSLILSFSQGGYAFPRV